MASVDEDVFNEKLNELVNRRSGNSLNYRRDKYVRLLEKIKLCRSKTAAVPKNSLDFRIYNKLKVVKTNEGERIATNPSSPKLKSLMLVPIEEMYDILLNCHMNLGHAGRIRMMSQIKKKYKNITAQIISLFISLCTTCKIKRQNYSKMQPYKNNRAEKQNIVQESLFAHPELYSRGQVDLLYVNNVEDKEYKFLMIYRNLATRFTHLNVLKQFNANEATEKLLEIFLVFGAPNVLQSKNGITFVELIVKQIRYICPEIRIVASETNFNENVYNGRNNKDILKLLNDWLNKTQSVKWYEGVKFVQHSLNTAFNEVLCHSPSEMVFGMNPWKGLTSMLPENVYRDLSTEDDLKIFLDQYTIEVQNQNQLNPVESSLLPVS
ncbi:KRAB-A domain-containing protein 2-like [Bombyx mandarina]|uniref:KRAB-A domain-containing protein 2-like n=1 Tax=Bombyx mandarina TaxID=7092 RepID=A0A6J2JD78_BOMMA|nr:KRAB-A domain-containing protein 2-like [Bombyx mandarina]